MQITASQQSLINWATQQRDLAKQYGDAVTAAAIDEAITQFTQNKFVLAILGKAKRGKSTLLNALLGRRDDLVAPIDKLPASSAITRFYWNETETAVVHFRDGKSQQIQYKNVRDYVTEEANPENRKAVNIVEVGGPFRGMDHDLILVDTPGAGSIHEYHDQILQEFIPQADAVLYLVTARMPLDQDELDLLKMVKAADVSKVFFAINKIDATNEEDLENAEKHNRLVLSGVGVSVNEMHHISAKRAFEGDVDGSGLPKLCSEINGFLKDGKAHLLAERFKEKVNQLVQPLRQGLTMQLSLAQQSAAERATTRKKAEEKKQSLSSQRVTAERMFTHTWKSAVDEFDGNMTEAQHEVDAALQNRIEGTSITSVGSLAKELPTMITGIIEEQLTPYSRKLENELREACEVLQTSYPALRIDSTGTVSIVIRKDQDALLKAGAGVALAGAGAAIATTAAGAAATAAAAASAAAATAAATAAAGATTASSAGLLAGLASMISPALGGIVGSIFGAGTATTAAAVAPAAVGLSWFVIAGPVGWAIAGLGALTVPLVWRKHKIKTKEQLAQAAKDQINSIFKHIKSDRVPALRKAGSTILEKSRIQLDAEIQHCDEAIKKADMPTSAAELTMLRELDAKFQATAVPG